MTQHPREIGRDEQIAGALRVLERARELGWAKVTVEVTRGGTVRVDAEDRDGAKVVAKPEWRAR